MPKRRACGSSAASGVAPLTCATHGPGASRIRDLRDRPIGHAQEDELGLVGVEAHAALGEACAHRSTDASTRAYDSDSLDHRLLQFRLRIPGSRRVAACGRAAASRASRAVHSARADLRVRLHGVRVALRGARPLGRPGRRLSRVRRGEGPEAVFDVRRARCGKGQRRPVGSASEGGGCCGGSCGCG